MRVIFGHLFLLFLLAGFVPPSSASPNGGEPGTVSVGPAGITYYAHGGDTLSAIALQFTGRTENWVAIGKLNRIGKDVSIPIGTAILIPAELLGDEPVQATVVARSGTVSARKPDGSVAAVGVGAVLPEGTQLETGANSFLTMALPDSSRFSLPSNSRVRLAKLRVTRYTRSPRTEIFLLNGRIESRVAPLEANRGRFEVRTQQSAAGVRGTNFRVGLTGNGVATEVLSGKVAVGNRANPDALLLNAGSGNLIDAQTVGPARDLLPAPQLAGNGAQHSYPAPQFALAALPGARAYHLQLATDAEAQNVIAENYAAEPEVRLEGIADGRYFVRISAIDRHGLEGYSRILPVELKNGHSTAGTMRPGAPSIAHYDAREITLSWPARPGKTYTLQVARDAAFTWLQSSAESSSGQARLPRPPFGTYYARVRQQGADGSASEYSHPQAFIVTDQWVINDGMPVGIEQTQSGPAR
jgi:hypothetical protein